MTNRDGDMELAQSVALVTGASRGIGAAIAGELAARGAQVVLTYREDEEGARAVVERIVSAGGKAEAHRADVRDAEAVGAVADEVVARFGAVDVLVNNAGILSDRTFRKMRPEQWREVIETNLIGVFNCSHAVIGAMTERRRGRILNIASFVGQSGAYGQTNYAAAKAGVIGFTRSLALEAAGAGITVNAICPGFIETDMWRSIPAEHQTRLLQRIPLGRTGQTHEIAALVRFLIEEGGYITGQTLNINGGLFIG